MNISNVAQALEQGDNNTVTLIALPVHIFQPTTQTHSIIVDQNILLNTLADGTIILDTSQLSNKNECSNEENIENNGQIATIVETVDSVEADNRKVRDTQNKKAKIRYLHSKGQKAKGSEEKSISVRTYKCKECNEEFSKYSLLKQHEKSHTDEKKYVCENCPASFNILSNYLLHSATHNTSDPTCPECGKKFQRVASLKAHLMHHEKEETFYCQECDICFGNASDLNEHVKEHGKEKKTVLKCKLCQHISNSVSEHKKHTTEHRKTRRILQVQFRSRKKTAKERRHQCTVCKKSFQKQSQIERHMRVHSGEKPFVCTVCSRGFSQKGSLQIHMTRHSGVKPHKCVLCPAEFSQKGNLRAHILKTHSVPRPGENTFSCSECSCVFKKLGSLNGHMTRNHPEQKETDLKSVMSQIEAMHKTLGSGNDKDILQQAIIRSDLAPPSTTFVTLADRGLDGTVRRYVVRQRRAGDIRWHQCSYCTKEFKKPSDLVRHLRVHTREKPFRCRHCPRAFAVKSTLTSHLRTHLSSVPSGPPSRPHTCAACGAAFRCLGQLKRHHACASCDSDSRRKPYVCSVCRKTFKTFSACLKHTKLHGDQSEVAPSEEPSVSISPPPPIPPLCNLPVPPATEDVLQAQMLDIIGAESFVDVTANNAISTTDELVSTLADNQPQQQVYDIDSLILTQPLFLEDLTQPQLEAVQVVNELPLQQEPQQQHRNQCSYCPKSFRKPSDLQRHIRTHTGERPFKCHECAKSFTLKSTLESHSKIHRGRKEHTCQVCDSLFSSKGSLQVHMRLHTGAKPFACPLCKLSFRTSGHRKAHLMVHYREAARTGRPPAEAITRKTKMSRILEATVQTMLDPVPPPAPPPMITQSRTSLEDDNQVFRLEIRTDERGQVLHIQPAADSPVVLFDGDDKIKRQIETLLRENAAKTTSAVPTPTSKFCPFCSKDFKTKYLLDRHIKIHTGEKTFSCSHCSKMFNQKNALEAHIRVHVGSRPYACNYCSNTFNQSGNLKTHIKRIHANVSTN